jgi:hypothetical protein
MKQLFIGLIAEGTTDVRFLKNVIYKSIQELSWSCDNQVDIFDIQEVTAEGDSFVNKMLAASKNACQTYGISVLCIHADSDASTMDTVMQNKFEPFFSALKDMSEDEYCKHIIPTIPIQMIESWMLADKELLKRLINAKDMSDADLGLDRAPESYADPKSAIENAIRRAMAEQPKKKRNLVGISDLYEILGNRLSLERLRTIPSFAKFEENVIIVFKNMGLMR